MDQETSFLLVLTLSERKHEYAKKLIFILR
jgi:hypothetical protein